LNIEKFIFGKLNVGKLKKTAAKLNWRRLWIDCRDIYAGGKRKTSFSI
jgi:hypothetical protein